jgi:hypothetical protein
VAWTPKSETLDALALRGLVHSTDLRTLALWAAPAALLFERDAGPADPGKGLEGAWDVYVEVVNGTGDDSTAPRFEFRPDHTILAIGPIVEDGDPEFLGIGYWLCLPDGEFAFGVNHPGIPDAEGGSSGAIFAFHRGRIEGDGFVTSGLAVIEQGAGKPWIGPAQIRATGTRADQHEARDDARPTLEVSP